MKTESTLTKQQVIAQLTRSTHGDLTAYVPITRQAAGEDPEFLAHLIAWNQEKGAIRDSKLAVPAASLISGFPYAENSLAHIALLDPRNMVKALSFAKTHSTHQKALSRVVERYLRAREAKFGWWEKTAVQHRSSLKTLYAKYHIKPAGFAQAILFKGEYPKGSIFSVISGLKDMPAMEAAGTIMEKRIPFLVAISALGKRSKETEIVLALIERMTPTELVTNTKMLERMGIKDNPPLRAAFEAGLQKVASSKKQTLKTQRAAEAMTDEKLKAKLIGAVEKQIQNLSIDGNWLVLGDKSGSMATAIEVARLVSATLAKMVKGDVYLIFFDNTPRFIDVTGKSYDQIKAMTAGVTAGGGTSIGCGVQYAIDKGFDVSGIAVVSDGGENGAPMFVPTYQKLCASLGRDVPVYFYRAEAGDGDMLSERMQASGLEMQTFDLRSVDYHSLPNLVQTMRASRYSLTDEIMATPLLTLDEVFKEAA